MNQFKKGVFVGPMVHVARELEKIINDLDSKRRISCLISFMDYSELLGVESFY